MPMGRAAVGIACVIVSAVNRTGSPIRSSGIMMLGIFVARKTCPTNLDIPR
jgi:hypothetical protein